MRFSIWKFPIELTGNVQEVSMPSGAKILSCQTQGNAICVWARVDQDRGSAEKRKFLIVGTGMDMDPSIICWDFVSTIQQGQFVWHIFTHKV